MCLFACTCLPVRMHLRWSCLFMCVCVYVCICLYAFACVCVGECGCAGVCITLPAMPGACTCCSEQGVFTALHGRDRVDHRGDLPTSS